MKAFEGKTVLIDGEKYTFNATEAVIYNLWLSLNRLGLPGKERKVYLTDSQRRQVAFLVGRIEEALK